MRIHGQTILALVDTGSELSLIPTSLVRSGDMTQSQQMLKAENGTSVKVLGETLVESEISGVTFRIHCLVAEQLSEMILGLNWLEQKKATWNFVQRGIQLQGQMFSLYSLLLTAKCRKVAKAYDVKVPSMCELDV